MDTKKEIQSAKELQEDLKLRHDFCFVISGKLNEAMMEAICEDLHSSQFNCDFR
jgi:hypothetical protein